MEIKKSPKKTDYTLSSVKNALRLLHCFTMDEPEKKIADLSKETGLGKSTVSRLILTLASEGFVIKDPRTNRYRLGTSLLSFSAIVTKHLDIYRESFPIVRDIVEKLNETVHVSILEGTNVVYVHVMECNHPIRYFATVGDSNPAYCTSSGKTILAFQDDEVIQKIVSDGLEAYTDNTITDPMDLLNQLQSIRSAGYALSNQELRQGVMGVAAPIRNHQGQVFAAVSIVGPMERMNESKIPLYVEEIKDAALQISRRLGFAK